MDNCLSLSCLGIGLMIGGMIAFLRGNGNNRTIISFIFGTLLGGSFSPFLKIENTSPFFFSMKVLGFISIGVIIGLILVALFMEWIYTRESERAIKQKNSNI